MVNKKSESILKGIAGILALLLFAGLVFSAKEFDRGTDTTYEIVCLGDSNLGNFQSENGIVELLEKRMGQPIFNGGFGGSTMTSIYENKTDYSASLSMYQLAIAIRNKNFGVQKSAIGVLDKANKLGYFKNTLDELTKIDFDNVKILIIEHGVNDYLGGVTIKNGQKPDDINTFSGTIRETLSMLKKEYPEMRIIIVTPTYCAPASNSEGYRFCDEYNYGGGYLEEYVNAEIEVAQEMNVEVIDLYHKMGVDKNNVTEYLFDGLHYNDEARGIVADIIADYLLGETQ